jgi:hypothetical protein
MSNNESSEPVNAQTSEGGHPLRETVERLLFEDESNVLDFKVDQYLFGKGTEEQRGELLKDILAMANSWGRADTRYILVGVREKVGGRAEVVGVNEHLPEHALQQMVNGRTNRPVELSYHGVEIDGQSVGVIVIPRQHRPTFLKKTYGRLEANTVYVRRGSATAIADPDEIAQMGASNVEREVVRTADLQIRLGYPDRREVFESETSISVEPVVVPPPSSLPDYERRRSSYDYSGILSNRNYYRDVARYLWAARATLVLGYQVQNIGDGAATNVTIRMEVIPESGYAVLAKPVEEPDEHNWITNALVEHAEEQKRPYRPKIRDGSVREVRYDLGVVQPGLTLWTDPFYLVVERVGKLELHVEIYSDQLPVPQTRTFTFDALGHLTEVDSATIVAAGNRMLQRER